MLATSGQQYAGLLQGQGGACVPAARRSAQSLQPLLAVSKGTAEGAPQARYDGSGESCESRGRSSQDSAADSMHEVFALTWRTWQRPCSCLRAKLGCCHRCMEARAGHARCAFASVSRRVTALPLTVQSHAQLQACMQGSLLSFGAPPSGPHRPGGGGEGNGSVCTLEQERSWRPPAPGWRPDIAGGALSCRGMYCYVRVLGVPAGAHSRRLHGTCCKERSALSSEQVGSASSLCGQPLLPQYCLYLCVMHQCRLCQSFAYAACNLGDDPRRML
jgi:hypothetical protein